LRELVLGVVKPVLADIEGAEHAVRLEARRLEVDGLLQQIFRLRVVARRRIGLRGDHQEITRRLAGLETSLDAANRVLGLAGCDVDANEPGERLESCGAIVSTFR
jgi:hypothetical protein